MTDSSADRCYRHPDRQSWVLCQRCGRTICGECQTPAPVGVLCPECVRDSRAEARTAQRSTRRRSGAPTGLRRWLGRPSAVTLTIVILTAVVGVLQIVAPAIDQLLVFYAPAAVVQPWRLLTAALLHASLLHFIFNMYCVWILGPQIEQAIGRLAFVGAYATTAIAGSVAVAFLAPQTPVLGASGAIFGLFGIAIGMQRMLGRVNMQLVIIVALNFVLGLVIGGISWQAHLGGLIVGLAIGFGTVWWDRRSKRGMLTRSSRVAVAAALVVVLAAWGVWILL